MDSDHDHTSPEAQAVTYTRIMSESEQREIAYTLSESSRTDEHLSPIDEAEVIGQIAKENVLVAKGESDQIVGAAIAEPLKDGWVYVGSVFVSPGARGRGIGTGLILDISDAAGNEGRSVMYDTTNPAMHKIARKLGFIDVTDSYGKHVPIELLLRVNWRSFRHDPIGYVRGYFTDSGKDYRMFVKVPEHIDNP